MAKGKNKIIRWARVYVGGYDLSGNARNFSRLENSFQAVDMTVWNDVTKKYLSDKQRRVGIRGFQALLDDSAAGAFSVMKSPYTTPTRVTLAFGGSAEPSNGDPAYFLSAAQLNDKSEQIAQAGVIRGDWLPDPGTAGDYTPLGVLLQGATSLTATTSSPSIDNGAESTNGFHAILHLIASIGGAAWALEVEHSINNSDWSQLALFAINGSTISSDYQKGAGTVNRYVRFTATRTNGTITAVCAFARG